MNTNRRNFIMAGGAAFMAQAALVVQMANISLAQSRRGKWNASQGRIDL
jgi:hypothetical protein